jgi:hypothetical protein
VIAHEIVHNLHKTKKPGVIIKLDYKKTYDRVNLNFLFEILKSRGFGETWIGWVRKIVMDGSVSVMANGEKSNTYREIPCLPCYLILLGDVLTKMLIKASRGGLDQVACWPFNIQIILCFSLLVIELLLGI